MACTEVQQKHDYDCFGTGTEGNWIRFLAKVQISSASLWELQSSGFPNFYIICNILQYLQ